MQTWTHNEPAKLHRLAVLAHREGLARAVIEQVSDPNHADVGVGGVGHDCGGTISSMELTLEDTAFSATSRSPVDRPEVSVAKLKRITEGNMKGWLGLLAVV